MIRKFTIILIMLLPLLSFSVRPGYAGVARGGARILASTMAIPVTMIEHSKRVMFPFGLVTGALVGTARTVFGTLAGAVEVAQGSAPYAKYAALFI